MGNKKGNQIDQVKNEEQYEKLKEKGMSKEKAARIANSDNSGKGGKQDKYENWTREELYDKAAEVGIEGRSDMDKDELIHSLRNH